MFTSAKDEYNRRGTDIWKSHLSTQLMTRHRLCNATVLLCINRRPTLTYMYQIYVAYSRHRVPDEQGYLVQFPDKRCSFR
jgi:hypothetical protein